MGRQHDNRAADFFEEYEMRLILSTAIAAVLALAAPAFAESPDACAKAAAAATAGADALVSATDEGVFGPDGVMSRYSNARLAAAQFEHAATMSNICAGELPAFTALRATLEELSAEREKDLEAQIAALEAQLEAEKERLDAAKAVLADDDNGEGVSNDDNTEGTNDKG